MDEHEVDKHEVDGVDGLELDSLMATEQEALAELRAYEEQLEQEARTRAKLIRERGQYYAV